MLAGRQEAGTTGLTEIWQLIFKTTVLGETGVPVLTGSLTLKDIPDWSLRFVSFAYSAWWHLPPQPASNSGTRPDVELPQIELCKWQVWKKSHLHLQNKKYLVPYRADSVRLQTFPWAFTPLPPPVFVSKKLNAQDVSWRFWHGLIWIKGLMMTLLPTYRNFSTKLSYKNSCLPGFVCFLPNHCLTFIHLQTQK